MQLRWAWPLQRLWSWLSSAGYWLAAAHLVTSTLHSLFAPPDPFPLCPAVKIHRNFKEALTIRTGFAAEAIHGGQLLGVRAQDFIVFYDWATGKVIDLC